MWSTAPYKRGRKFNKKNKLNPKQADDGNNIGEEENEIENGRLVEKIINKNKKIAFYPNSDSFNSD
jgi:hypothetical protein